MNPLDRLLAVCARLEIPTKNHAVRGTRHGLPTWDGAAIRMPLDAPWLAHEIGHFLGLVAHSRRCVDVTSYYHDGKGRHCLTNNIAGIRSVTGLIEYRSELPTACDIARCQRANGRQ